MCGRFVISDTHPDLVALFDVDIVGETLPEPSWNVRPTDQVRIVLESNKGGPAVRRLESARWSLVPPFATELASRFPTFNARSEDVAEKASFQSSVVSRRAIIPASGYIEWHTVGEAKTPYFVHAPDDGVLAIAGLYSWWRDPQKADTDPTRWVLSATILTAEASGRPADLHHRTPVVLPDFTWDSWLDPDEEADQEFVDAAVDASRPTMEELEFHEIAPVTGNAPAVVEPAMIPVGTL
ncbi:MAG: SOS response-associated peptidase [Leifsonia sp.]